MNLLDLWTGTTGQTTRSAPSERGPSAPVPSDMYKNWAGVDIMYYLDGRRRRQALVYFGNSQGSSANRDRECHGGSGSREGMIPGRYSEIFGRGEQLAVNNYDEF